MSTLFKQPPDILKGKATGSSDILGGEFSNSPPDLLRNTSGPVMSVFGRTGYVIAQLGDYTASLVTNAVDQTASYANPVWITSLDYSKILNAPAIPSISACQTPWLQDIDAKGHDLNNLQYLRANEILLNGPSTLGPLVAFSVAGSLRWTLSTGNNEGSGNTGSDFFLTRYADNGSFLNYPIRVDRVNSQVTLGGPLAVTGNCNITGQYLINGVPLAPGGSQTPWQQDIDAFSHSLNNVDTVTSNGAGLVFTKPWQVGNTAGGSIEWHNGALKRWAMTPWNQETGSNIGSDVILSAFDDTGAYLFTPITVRRSTGNLELSAALLLTSSGTRRWMFAKSGAETGSNAGSDFILNRYGDSGSIIDTPFTMTRATGDITFTHSMTIASSSPPTVPLDVYGPARVQRTLTIYDPTSNGTSLNVTAVAGNTASVLLQTGGSARWLLSKSGTAEGGSNAGSDFFIYRYDDTGAYLGVALTILRASNYVGINLNNPTRMLHVYGAAGAPSLSASTGELAFFDTSNTNALAIGAAGASPYAVWLQGKRRTNDGSSWPIALNPVGGRVAIGNLNPGYPLDVTGDISCSGYLRGQATLLSGVTATPPTYYMYVNGYVKWATITRTAESSGNVGSDFAIQNYSDTGAYLGLPFFIKRSTGYVGLNGNVTPRAPLHVISANASDVGSISAAGGGFALSNSSGNYGLSAGVLSGGQAWLQAGRFDGVSTGYSLMLQPAGGFVGINGANPAYALDVTGDINTSGVFRVNGTPLSTSGAMTYRGAWNGGTLYAVNDVILYNGIQYIRLIASNPSTSPAVVQSKGITGAASLAFASNVTQGNLLVVAGSSSHSDPGACADNLGTVYSETAHYNSFGDFSKIYYGVAPSSGACTPTFAAGSGSSATRIFELQNCNPVVNANATAAQGSTNPSSLSLTTTVANTFAIVSIFEYYANPVVYAATAGQGTTFLFTTTQANGAAAASYKSIASASANTLGFTVTAGSGYDYQVIVAAAFTTGAQTPDIDTVNWKALTSVVTTQTLPSRTLGTAYQNNTGKPMLVSVSVTVTSGTATAYADTNSSPATQVQQVATTTALVFWVLPTYFYKVTTTGTVTLVTWTEWN